jgi:hypothetical protein
MLWRAYGISPLEFDGPLLASEALVFGHELG